MSDIFEWQDVFDRAYKEHQKRVAYNLEKQAEDKIRQIVRNEIIKTKAVQTTVTSDTTNDITTTVVMERWADGTFFLKDCIQKSVKEQNVSAYLVGFCDGYRQGRKQ